MNLTDEQRYRIEELGSETSSREIATLCTALLLPSTSPQASYGPGLVLGCDAAMRCNPPESAIYQIAQSAKAAIQSSAPQEAPEKVDRGAFESDDQRTRIKAILDSSLWHDPDDYAKAVEGLDRVFPTTPPATPATPPWPVAGSKLMIGGMSYIAEGEGKPDARVWRRDEPGIWSLWLTDAQAIAIRETNRKAALCDELLGLIEEIRVLCNRCGNTLNWRDVLRTTAKARVAAGVGK